MKIAYEPHPVSPARKAELRAAGFKIIDAKFAPAGEVTQAHKAEVAVTEQAAKVADKPKLGRPKKVVA